MVGNVGESWFRVVVADAGLFSVENESFVSHGAEVMPVYLPEWHVGNTGGYYFYPIVFPLLFTHAGNGLAGGGEGLVGGFAEVANSGVFKGGHVGEVHAVFFLNQWEVSDGKNEGVGDTFPNVFQNCDEGLFYVFPASPLDFLAGAQVGIVCG